SPVVAPALMSVSPCGLVALFVPAALPPLLDTVHERASLPSLPARTLPARRALLTRLGNPAPTGHHEHRTRQHDEETPHAQPDLLGEQSGDEERDTEQEARGRLVDPSPGVRTQPASLKRCRELGIFGVQRSLHLLEHSLLVLRERHGVLLIVQSPGRPGVPSR